jgi:hypothetical protein
MPTFDMAEDVTNTRQDTGGECAERVGARQLEIEEARERAEPRNVNN